MKTEHIRPQDIEKRSFEIISEELDQMKKEGKLSDVSAFSEVEMPVVKRCIHTTADFDYASTLRFSGDAANAFAALIRQGATIVTDTNMALSGINKIELAKYGCDIKCYMADEEVGKEAKERELTRAGVSMEKAMQIDGPVIFVVGNAPTALMTLKEAYDKGTYIPAFIIGVPVGFVNVVAAKEMILESDIPYIVNSGRKGGSNVAAAIVNAMLYAMRDGKL